MKARATKKVKLKQKGGGFVFRLLVVLFGWPF
jgi:hypothetical protein